MGRGRPRALLGAGQAGLHPPSRARPVEALRRRLRQGRHVSDPDPHPRHSGLPDHAAHRHALEGHHGPALSAADDANTDIGTIFHEKLADGCMPKQTQMRFAPNTGYAFAVGDDTWHSADAGAQSASRRAIRSCSPISSIRACCEVLRNRGKRLGNFVLNEMRQIRRRSDRPCRIKTALTRLPHRCGAMVSHRRRRTILTALGALYLRRAVHRLFRGQCLYRQSRPARASRPRPADGAPCKASSTHLKAERALWERRVALLRSDRLDPDMLDERARALLGLCRPARPDAPASITR